MTTSMQAVQCFFPLPVSTSVFQVLLGLFYLFVKHFAALKQLLLHAIPLANNVYFKQINFSNNKLQ